MLPKKFVNSLSVDTSVEITLNWKVNDYDDRNKGWQWFDDPDGVVVAVVRLVGLALPYSMRRSLSAMHKCCHSLISYPNYIIFLQTLHDEFVRK